MSENLWIGLVGFLILIIQGLVAYYVSSINDKIKTICAENKEDHKDIWSRVYGHYHEIECESAECGKVHTGNVIIPSGGA